MQQASYQQLPNLLLELVAGLQQQTERKRKRTWPYGSPEGPSCSTRLPYVTMTCGGAHENSQDIVAFRQRPVEGNTFAARGCRTRFRPVM